MILPNKLVPFKDCILQKTIYILNVLGKSESPVSELFIQVKDSFEDVAEFIIALDVLFVLDRIVYDENLKVIRYARKN